MFRVWSEDGNYVGTFDTYSAALMTIMEFGGIIMNQYGVVVEKNPKTLDYHDWI